jgi:hypothetical protein
VIYEVALRSLHNSLSPYPVTLLRFSPFPPSPNLIYTPLLDHLIITLPPYHRTTHSPHTECSALCSMGVSDIFVFVADAIYDYALAADTMQDTDEDDEASEGDLCHLLPSTLFPILLHSLIPFPLLPSPLPCTCLM